MFDNSKIENALALLRKQIEQANLNWVEPQKDSDEYSLVFRFYGDKYRIKEKESARFIIWSDDNNENACCYLCCDLPITELPNQYDFFGSYKRYLELNGWLEKK